MPALVENSHDDLLTGGRILRQQDPQGARRQAISGCRRLVAGQRLRGSHPQRVGNRRQERRPRNGLLHANAPSCSQRVVVAWRSAGEQRTINRFAGTSPFWTRFARAVPFSSRLLKSANSKRKRWPAAVALASLSMAVEASDAVSGFIRHSASSWQSIVRRVRFASRMSTGTSRNSAGATARPRQSPLPPATEARAEG